MLNKKSFSILMLLVSLPLLAAEGGHHGPDVVELIARTLNVAVFAGILFYFLKTPVADFFATRVSKIKSDLEMAKTSRIEAEKRLAEIEEKMSGLDLEVEAIAQKARADAEREKARLKEKVELETEKIREQAAKDIAHAKSEALTEVKRYVVDLAMEQVEDVLKDRMTKQDQERLVQKFAEKLGA
ncbi:MAG: hypothetical protein CSA81_04915 [Acidobacteria bacterium]|nr:MAG: hypothetical protein CSA81_04915 [Acidobacteriota bacterium]PIE91069.1 MAG: hypothetical protein CR997_02820 [Acidobacteriota bacterium]